MKEEWWESPACWLCDWWWTLLIVLALGLAAYLTRGYWMPAPPPPTATMTLVPTPSPLPTFTPRPSPTPTLEPTPTPEPTATRVETLGTGDVQVTLIWDSVNDLDLWVTDPSGESIYYGHTRSESNGELDVDANPACGGLTTTPVENIFWPEGLAPSGSYKVTVKYFQVCQAEARTPFTVRLLVNGETQTFEDVVSLKDEVAEITTFTME